MKRWITRKIYDRHTRRDDEPPGPWWVSLLWVLVIVGVVVLIVWMGSH